MTANSISWQKAGFVHAVNFCDWERQNLWHAAAILDIPWSLSVNNLANYFFLSLEKGALAFPSKRAQNRVDRIFRNVCKRSFKFRENVKEKFRPSSKIKTDVPYLTRLRNKDERLFYVFCQGWLFIPYHVLKILSNCCRNTQNLTLLWSGITNRILWFIFWENWYMWDQLRSCKMSSWGLSQKGSNYHIIAEKICWVSFTGQSQSP